MRLTIVAALAAVLSLLGCDALERRHAMKALPSTLQAEAIEFGRNEVFGFGPGGNETGFYVIRLGAEGVDLAARGGVAWLNAQTGGRLDPDWFVTPVPRDDYWMGRADSALGAFPDPTVTAILDRYGFGFDLPPEHQSALDSALNSPGSYYAFGRGGLVAVVVPAAGRAYVFYAG
ncbi:MAG: hypothetical protein MUE52_10400 [Tabrizicola sp.]|nr:hypothetical protein [Tabrizicola sp.]